MSVSNGPTSPEAPPWEREPTSGDDWPSASVEEPSADVTPEVAPVRTIPRCVECGTYIREGETFTTSEEGALPMHTSCWNKRQAREQKRAMQSASYETGGPGAKKVPGGAMKDRPEVPRQPVIHKKCAYCSEDMVAWVVMPAEKGKKPTSLHEKCLRPWLEVNGRRCPTCRYVVDPTIQYFVKGSEWYHESCL